MSEINVVLVHADAREDQAVTTGTKAWELFQDDPRGHRGARRRRRCATWPTSSPTATRSSRWRIDSADGRDILRHSTAHVMAQAVQDLFPDAKLGIGPPIENGFYYDFDVETPFVPEDLEKIETRMRKIIKENQRFSRRPVSDDDAREELADEPYKLELIGLKGSAADAAEGASAEVGAGELTIYDNIDRKGEVAWKDLCRGPHLPDHQADPGVQADALGRGVLARQREEQAAAAHLRHRLGEQGGARGAPPPPRGGREARPPQARPRPRPVQLPRRDRLRPAGLPPQGWGDQAGDGGLRPAAPHRGGLRVRRHAAHLQGGALPHLRPPAVLRRRDVPADGVRGRQLLPQGDELPDAQPDLQVARAVLPRAAAAALRVRARLPLREVGRDPRADPRAGHDPGRLATPTSPRSRRPTRSSTCWTSASACSATSASTTSTSSCRRATTPTRTSSSAPTRTGPSRPRCSRRSAGVRARARARPGRRGVLRPEDLGAGARRHRPHLADVDDPVRLQPAQAASTSSTRRPTGRASSR